jgi:demethylmacrocin O-methyltransferase
MFSRKLVQHMVIDTTHTYTELCDIGRLAKTDKTPYGNKDLSFHRHPYTGVYSTLFSPLKHKEIEFAEIGIAGGSSVILWWNYFSKGSFSFFDCDPNFLINVEKMGFPSRSPYLGLMDVSIDGNVRDSLLKTGKQFDVIIDDSSHVYEHQIRIVKEAFPFVKSGGYLIVEDIYRSTPEDDYIRDLKDIFMECAMVYFVICNHEERYSPGWNNDKLLVLVKA